MNLCDVNVITEVVKISVFFIKRRRQMNGGPPFCRCCRPTFWHLIAGRQWIFSTPEELLHYAAAGL